MESLVARRARCEVSPLSAALSRCSCASTVGGRTLAELEALEGVALLVLSLALFGVFIVVFFMLALTSVANPPALCQFKKKSIKCTLIRKNIS